MAGDEGQSKTKQYSFIIFQVAKNDIRKLQTSLIFG